MDESGLPVSEIEELEKIIVSEKEFLGKLGDLALDMPLSEIGSFELNTGYDIVYGIYEEGTKLILRADELENYRRTQNYQDFSKRIRKTLAILTNRLNDMCNESSKRAYEGDPIL